MRTEGRRARVLKYQRVLDILSNDIRSGKYLPGDQLPSEAALVQRFGISRITVGRALRDLAQRGLVERIAGSGTYVRDSSDEQAGLLFGLLIPDLGRTEIFDPICQGIAGAPESQHHALIWAHMEPAGTGLRRQALELCDQYIQRRVSGVFFAPIEAEEGAVETNLAIASKLEREGIPIVLLDRCVLPYPRRSAHDLVGIDNRRAAYLASEHLLDLGAPTVSFLAHRRGAPTVDARIAGFREAALARGLPLERAKVHRVDEFSDAVIRSLLDGCREGDGFVCANDRTAGELMHALLAAGRRIPRDVRVVGIDDVEYASLLPVPLTTIHQPCREIGEAAMGVMLERVRKPHLAIRDILLETSLVVRDSCGAQQK